MGSAGSYIECQRCGGTYSDEVLSYDPVAIQRKTNDDIRRLLVLAAMAEGSFDATRIASLQAAYAELTNIHVDEQELLHDVRQAQEVNAQLVPFVQAVATDLTEKGKQHILSAAYATLSDRPGRQHIRDEVLLKLGMGLGMHQAVVNQLLQRMNQVS
jgi:hypothetical protein